MADAEVVSIETARARRRAAIILDAELAHALEELCETMDVEDTTSRARLAHAALLKLRSDLTPVADAGGRALVPVEALYALVREVVESRVELRTVRGAWESYTRGRVARGDFENDISCVAECFTLDGERETLDFELTIETGAAP